MKKTPEKLLRKNILSRMENSLSLRALKKGLMLTIPFLLIGSFCLVLTSSPIPAVEDFVTNFAGGRVEQVLQLVYLVTMGMMVIPAIVGISYSYANMIRSEYMGCYVMTSLLNYIIFAGEQDLTFSVEMFNALHAFTAILITLFTCNFLRFLFRFAQKILKKNYLSGLDLELQSVLSTIVPVVIVILAVLMFKVLCSEVFHVDVSNFGTDLMKHLFERLGTGLLGSTIFIALNSALWFFGIHGENMLSYVSWVMFEGNLWENVQLISEGAEAVHIFSRTFFDTMLFMGGSGSTMALLFALLIASNQKSQKKLFKYSIIPGIFNINEVIIFGLPVIFNPILIIPFILTPPCTVIF